MITLSHAGVMSDLADRIGQRFKDALMWVYDRWTELMMQVLNYFIGIIADFIEDQFQVDLNVLLDPLLQYMPFIKLFVPVDFIITVVVSVLYIAIFRWTLSWIIKLTPFLGG